MTSFVLVNDSTDPLLTSVVLDQIASALEVQLNRDVSPIYGGNDRVRAAVPDNGPAPGEVVCLITDTLPDAPGAIAYHDWTGTPDIYAGRSLCSSLMTGEGSLSQALSHELIEEIGDVGCNVWADDQAGHEWARELCDAVESGSYSIGAVGVSDFLLPSFFEPGATGPYSYMQAQGGTGPSAAFATAPSGYQIQRISGGGETQVWGYARAPLAMGPRAAKKRHWSSRTYRRGARVA